MIESESLATAILAQLARARPARLLAVGEFAWQLLAPYAGPSDRSIECLQPGAPLPPPPSPPYDLALLAGALEQLSPDQGSILLGRLRDLYARRIWAVLTEGAAGLDHRDLIGHGFRRLGRYPMQDRPAALYEFEIGTYKTTPDWLNSRHWANPQLFDKFRW